MQKCIIHPTQLSVKSVMMHFSKTGQRLWAETKLCTHCCRAVWSERCLTESGPPWSAARRSASQTVLEESGGGAALPLLRGGLEMTTKKKWIYCPKYFSWLAFVPQESYSVLFIYKCCDCDFFLHSKTCIDVSKIMPASWCNTTKTTRLNCYRIQGLLTHLQP